MAEQRGGEERRPGRHVLGLDARSRDWHLILDGRRQTMYACGEHLQSGWLSMQVEDRAPIRIALAGEFAGVGAAVHRSAGQVAAHHL